MNYKGFIYDVLDEHEKALIWFKKTLSIDPNNVQALKLKGDLLLELERYNEAIKTLNAALKVDPNNKEVLELLQKKNNESCNKTIKGKIF